MCALQTRAVATKKVSGAAGVVSTCLVMFSGVRAKQCIEKARGHVAAMISAKDSGVWCMNTRG